MNAHAVEKVLWDVVNAPATAPALRDTPAQYLAPYNLGADELALLSRMDAKALISLKINPMLVMRAWQMVHGRDQLPRYIAQLNAPGTRT
jgi:hypothetical protein